MFRFVGTEACVGVFYETAPQSFRANGDGECRPRSLSNLLFFWSMTCLREVKQVVALGEHLKERIAARPPRFPRNVPVYSIPSLSAAALPSPLLAKRRFSRSVVFSVSQAYYYSIRQLLLLLLLSEFLVSEGAKQIGTHLRPRVASNYRGFRNRFRNQNKRGFIIGSTSGFLPHYAVSCVELPTL